VVNFKDFELRISSWNEEIVYMVVNEDWSYKLYEEDQIDIVEVWKGKSKIVPKRC
jgi:hypothetical protein